MTHGGTFPSGNTYPNPGYPDVPVTTTGVLLDSICRFFGGPFDTTHHDYRTPTVPGLGFVRRAIVRPSEHDYAYLARPGSHPGSLMIVSVRRWQENRQTLGVGTGLKLRHSTVDLHLYTHSTKRDLTSVADDVHSLVDAVVARIDADPDCGTGGWEHGGLTFEGSSHGLQVDYHEQSLLKTYTQQRVVISAVASTFIQG